MPEVLVGWERVPQEVREIPLPGQLALLALLAAPGRFSVLLSSSLYIDGNSVVARKVTGFFFSFYLLVSVRLDSFQLPFLASCSQQSMKNLVFLEPSLTGDLKKRARSHGNLSPKTLDFCFSK